MNSSTPYQTGTIKTSPHEEHIRRALLSGMILEVSCHPSPGLVSPFSTGSHSDMNYYSFILSTAAIAPLLEVCVRAGYDWNGSDDLLSSLRPAGLSAEKAMFEANGGVNTQKGIIFLAGIVAASAGWISRQQGHLEAEKVCDGVAAIGAGLIQRELQNHSNVPSKTMTQGEHWYHKAGIAGIRGEAENGLPSVLHTGLPVFSETLRDHSLNTAMVQALLHLMTVVEDTTVLARAGMDGHEFVKKSARRVLSLGGLHTDAGQEALAEMEKAFIQRRISPGGSADLLAITIALWMMEHGSLSLQQIVDHPVIT